jgi:hypothetical protein
MSEPKEPKRPIYLYPWLVPVPGIPGPYMFEPPTCDEVEWQLIYRVKTEPEVPDWTPETTRVVRRPAEEFFQNLSTRRYWAARVSRVPSPR